MAFHLNFVAGPTERVRSQWCEIRMIMNPLDYIHRRGLGLNLKVVIDETEKAFLKIQ